MHYLTVCQRLCDFDLYPYPEEEINEEEVEEEQSSGKTEINKQDQGRRVRRRRRSVFRIVCARGAIPSKMGPTHCRATKKEGGLVDNTQTKRQDQLSLRRVLHRVAKCPCILVLLIMNFAHPAGWSLIASASC